MITVRKAKDRGRASHGSLETWHTFSFNTYYDPKHVSFRSLRVINDDVIAPKMGFGMHPHQDMEILTWVLDGALAHKDSSGGGGIIRPGELQHMSAGTGIRHSEFNASETEPARLLQIWIYPEKNGLKPAYGQKAFAPDALRNQLLEVASNQPQGDAICIHQDAKRYVSRLDADGAVERPLAAGRSAWVQVAKGSVELNGLVLEEGDGAAVEAEEAIQLKGRTAAEVLVFDLA
jgi:redox-sensitive bicupin YhaK (pirin superfamily)